MSKPLYLFFLESDSVHLKKYAIPSRKLPETLNSIPLHLLEDFSLNCIGDAGQDPSLQILKQILMTRSKEEVVTHQIKSLCRLCFSKSDVETVDDTSRQLAWKLLQIKVST